MKKERKSLLELRTSGFRKLRDGRIHMRCYSCGLKRSNVARQKYDPPNAVLIESPCEACCMGSKDPEWFYYDERGSELVPEYGDEFNDEDYPKVWSPGLTQAAAEGRSDG